MEHNTATERKDNSSVEVKQAFLSSAISDISAYIQLADTKVSIIMAAVVAIVVGAFSCHDLIAKAINQINPCSWLGVSLTILTIVLIISLIGVFWFGMLTIRSHTSKIGYKSKWFLPQSTTEYSFDAFKEDVHAMTDADIIENMAAELYKLNDINRQKIKTNKSTLGWFSTFLISTFGICVLLLLSKL